MLLRVVFDTNSVYLYALLLQSIAKYYEVSELRSLCFFTNDDSYTTASSVTRTLCT